MPVITMRSTLLKSDTYLMYISVVPQVGLNEVPQKVFLKFLYDGLQQTNFA